MGYLFTKTNLKCCLVSQMRLQMEPGALSYTIQLHARVVTRLKDNLFTGKDSPGIKIGMMQNNQQSLDRFPVDADRSMINWFCVEPGTHEKQRINLRNSVDFPINLNVMIRDSD